MTVYLAIAAGFVLLIVGGELLVRGAVSTAGRLGMSPLLIGLTLVGFGTSLPELVTSVEAARLGSPGLAFGNIVGSNIANILLILGLSAAISPIAVGARALTRDALLGLLAATVFAVLAWAMPLNRGIGIGLVAALVLYLYYAYRQESASAPGGHTAAYDKAEAFEEIHDGHMMDEAGAGKADRDRASPINLVVALLMVVVGLVAVVAGAKVLVFGASSLARSAGISESVIGLTVVAIGTSLPELVTSVVAAIRRHGDVALGNVLGSNLYNILGIGGATAAIAPSAVPQEMVRFDNLIMVLAAAVLIVFARSGQRISRIEGGILFALYCGYIYLVWPK